MALVLGFWLSAVIQAVVSKEGDDPVTPRRLTANDCTGMRPRSGIVVLFLCGGGAGAIHVPQGRELYSRNGFPVCFDKSGS